MSKHHLKDCAPSFVRVEEGADVIKVLLDAGIDMTIMTPKGGCGVSSVVFEHNGRLYLAENRVGHEDGGKNGFVAISAEGERIPLLATFIQVYVAILEFSGVIERAGELTEGESAQRN